MLYQIKILFVVLTSCGFLFCACNPDEDTDDNNNSNDIQAVIDNAKSEEAITSTFNTINHYGINEEGIKQLGYDSALVDTLIYTDGGFPVTLVIDFGSLTTGSDGISRSGKILAEFSGRWGAANVAAGTTVNVSFDGYKETGIERTGTLKITYNGGYEQNPPQPSFTTEANDMGLSFTTGVTTSINGSRTVIWLEGAEDINFTNDKFEISGTMTGTDSRGGSYISKIIDEFPLVRNNNCEDVSTFTSGRLELTPDSMYKRTIDFGDGTCDNTILIDINGWETSIDVSP